MICAFESGIVYNLLLNRFNKLSLLFKESLYKKMETIGIYKNTIIYKTEDTDTLNDNTFFASYMNSLVIFDNIFRVLLTLIYLIILSLLI